MKNCTCDKLNCDSECLCNCHRKRKYICGLCRKEKQEKELDLKYTASICKECSKELNYYGSD